MSAEVRLVGAFAVAGGITLLVTPIAIRLATAFGFLDVPGGYKGHAAATPYLGGAAVLLGFAVSALLFAEGFTHYVRIVGGRV